MLGGVRVEHTHGLAGHSDADAPLHAIADAILGAIGAGDIGEHFPDTDPAWQNAPSSKFLHLAQEFAAEKGLCVVNCDVTIITELPKLKDYKHAIKTNIAHLLGVHVDAVAVKAKTNEGMGWIGRGEGLAACAVVMME